MNFAEQLTDALNGARITMKKAADMLGIPYRTIQDWKRGEREPSEYVKNTVLKSLSTYRAEINEK